MKPHESIETAQMTFDQGRAEQAMVEGLQARRNSLVAKLSSLVNRFQSNIPLDARRPSSDGFLFNVGEVEGRHRRMFVTATSIKDDTDGITKAGLNFYVEVYEGEDIGKREVVTIDAVESGTFSVIEYMSEFLPIIESYDPGSVADFVTNEPKVRQLEAIEDSLAHLYDLNQSVVLLPELAPNT